MRGHELAARTPRPARQRRRSMATKVGETYLCEICGNKVKVLEAGDGELVCCGEPMKKQ
jgi:superoxide reductase